jgi:hypothetical protein
MADELEALELEVVEPDLPEEPGAPELEALDTDLPDEPERSELEALDPNLLEEPEALELEAVDPKLPDEPETPELEALDTDLPGALELEAADLDMADELEALELEVVEPDLPSEQKPDALELELPEELEARARSRGFDPVSDDSDQATDMDDLMRAIEFGPDPIPEEFDQENENALASMAELFNFESPDTIFSSLAELDFTPEPMEDLESLERERMEPDDSPETEVEELRPSFINSRFFTNPFMAALTNELSLLTEEDEGAEEGPETTQASDEDGEVITERDGVAYINESILTPDEKTLANLDGDFMDLIDSVLNDT